jgi:hypothetical protein
MKEKILIVDDQFGIRILLNEVLKMKDIKPFRQQWNSRLLFQA